MKLNDPIPGFGAICAALAGVAALVTTVCLSIYFWSVPLHGRPVTVRVIRYNEHICKSCYATQRYSPQTCTSRRCYSSVVEPVGEEGNYVTLWELDRDTPPEIGALDKGYILPGDDRIMHEPGHYTLLPLFTLAVTAGCATYLWREHRKRHPLPYQPPSAR